MKSTNLADGPWKDYTKHWNKQNKNLQRGPATHSTAVAFYIQDLFIQCNTFCIGEIIYILVKYVFGEIRIGEIRIGEIRIGEICIGEIRIGEIRIVKLYSYLTVKVIL